MRSTKKAKQTIKQWLHVSASPETRDRIWREILFMQEQSGKTNSALVQPDRWKTILRTKTARFAAAAVAALVVIGGLTFWPGRGTDDKKWWLAPPAAWSQEIADTLDTFKCVTCREQLIALEPDGSERTLAWMKRYTTNDRYRRDWYNKGFLEEIQWYVPDGSDMIQYSICFDSESYSTKTLTGMRSSGKSDPVEGLRVCIIGDLDNADRLLGTEVIEGRECVGFEIDTEDGMTDRIWFDVKTKLPVRIEHRNLPKSPGSDKRITIIRDQYDYDPGLPPETFVPYVPEGFVPYNQDESQIDIAITDENLTVTEQPDGSFKAEITIHNKCPDPFPKFKVEFYAGDPDKGGRFLARQTSGPIMPGDYVLSSHSGLSLRTNENTIFVVVNPRNRFPELNETNNKASKVIPRR